MGGARRLPLPLDAWVAQACARAKALAMREPPGRLIPEVRWVLIDPAAARALLARNRNRRHYPATTAAYARQMRAGSWVQGNGQTIQVDWNGDLRDGQHRLRAVVEAGTTQPFLVVAGVEPSVFAVIDVGLPRSPGDQVGIAADDTGAPELGAGLGSTQQKYAASAVRLLERMKDRPPHPFASTWEPGQRLTPPEITAAFATTWARDVVRQLPPAERIKGARVRGGPGLWAALLVLMWERDPEATWRFVDQVVTGADLPPGHPVLALRYRLAIDRGGGRGVTSTTRRVDEYARSIAYAWRAFRQGRTLEKLFLPPNAPFPYPE